MKNSKYAFTMIELVFVIVVLGILSAVAIPKLAANRDDAHIAKARADISSIRSAIITERQTRLIKGDSSWITSLSNGSNVLFTGNGTNVLLTYGVISDLNDTDHGDGKWITTDSAAPYDSYKYHLGVDVVFEYNNTDGSFRCLPYNSGNALSLCKTLID